MRPPAFVRTLVSVLLLAAAPALGEAQQIPSPYRFVETSQEAAVYGGVAQVNSGRFGFGPESGRTLGGRYSINISGPLAFEAEGAALQGTRRVIDPSRDEGQRDLGEADVLLASVEGRFTLTLTGDRTWNGWAPFLTAGGGIVFDLGDPQPLDEQLLPNDRFDFGSSFLGSLGVGSRFYLSDTWVLRGDVRFTLSQIDTPPGFSDADRPFQAVEESEWVNGGLFTLGLGYRF